ncbi:hypothetical protein T492DRAFT_1086281 [Pavlovales sp. CCMP2436]|nr:hypothetical protein T492DRAFT_1086281 [Pavlovales sp. CCMP2436]|mmetsp:Transcript_24900/g.63114  ORF Transcript_24900/g.63114 Transcript_24900/m.63114 type:complete len:326 (+) Transcript_24900:170-1147(+)
MSDDGVDAKVAAAVVGCGVGCWLLWRRRSRRQGSDAPPPRIVAGSPPSWTDAPPALAPVVSELHRALAEAQTLAHAARGRNELERQQGVLSMKPTLSKETHAPSWSTVGKSALLFTAATLLGIRLGRVRPFWRRWSSVHDIPASAFGDKAPLIRGRVVRVADGDTIRLLHTPTWFSKSRLSQGDIHTGTSLQLRLCTVDAPETAHFGKPAQPFGEDAKAFVEGKLLDRMVSVRLLMKDQYGRAVASVVRNRWPFRSHISEELLRAGLAEVYRGGGAVYGPAGKAHYIALEAKAKHSRRGMWAQKGKIESAAEFKARTKGSSTVTE